MCFFAGTGTWPLGVSAPQYITPAAEKQMIVRRASAKAGLDLPWPVLLALGRVRVQGQVMANWI